MRESTLQGKCIDYLSKLKNVYWINQYGNGMTAKGTPDLTLCIKGKAVFVELKVKKNKTSAIQEMRKQQIISAGGIYLQPYTFEQFKNEIDELMRGD